MTARELRRRAGAWLDASVRAVVVEIAAAHGSVPRGVGTRMVVAADAALGTIGGGHLELKAITFARALLASHRRVAATTQSFALGPSLGQCCGGAVSIAFAPLDAAALARWPASTPLFHLQLHGAGHVGRAVATLLATIDCDVDWFDEREDGFPAATALGSPWPAHIRAVSVDVVEREVAHAPDSAFYLVLTHEHALDLRIVEAILRRDDFGFCGLIGSKSKRASFASRLRARGVADDAIARMTCPIGVDAIVGKSPEVVALAAVAQLLAVASAQSARGEGGAAERALDARRHGERVPTRAGSEGAR